jgi:signal transduction histidine kinase
MSPSEKKRGLETELPLLEKWVPVILPVLKELWTSRIAALPAKPGPTLTDWLTLLHAAATAPDNIPRYLAQLFRQPQEGQTLLPDWVALTGLFSLTGEAVQRQADQLSGAVWADLLKLQNRILQTAATLAAASPPTDTAPLPRSDQYLHTSLELNKRILENQALPTFFKDIVDLIHAELGYEYANLFLWDQSRQSLRLQHGVWAEQLNPNPAPLISPTPATVTTQCAVSGQSMWINDLATLTDLAPHPLLPAIQAQGVVPILVDGQVHGVLEVASATPKVFSPDDRQILQALSGYLTVAIKNSQLRQTVQRHLREQSSFYESNIALGSSPSVGTVLQLIGETLTAVLEGGACVISKIEPQAKVVIALAEHIRAEAGNPASTWRIINQPLDLGQDNISQQVLATKRPVIGRAGKGKQPAWQKPRQAGPADPGWGTILALPFEITREQPGLIEIYDRNPYRNFSPDDIQLCQILASQTSLVLERTQLFDETRQRLSEVSTLYSMAQKIAANLNFQQVLDSIVVALRQVIGCRGCCIFLLDSAGEQLEIKAADGLKPEWRKMAKLRVGEGVAGRSVATGKTIYIPDTQQDRDFIYFDSEIRSLMVAPLWANRQIIGAINVDDKQANAFGPSQERLLTITATQAGIAIDNARLFNTVLTEQQQNQAIIQYIADGLLVIDKDGTITTCNPALTLMLKLSRNQIIGQKIGSPDMPANLASITTSPTRRARTGVLAKEVTIETPEPKILQIFATTMIDAEKQPGGEVRVVHDVTAERNLEQLKAEFMSTISHELRTPLFSIQGFVQILLEDEAEIEAETRREFLTTIHTQALQLTELVNNLLDMAKFDEGRLELSRSEVNLAGLLHNTSHKLRGFAHQQKIALHPDFPESLPPINGDAERLEQVLTNLIGNAIKFTPTGGQVTVKASLTASEILIEVSDTGIGIPPEALEHIFSRYYQVNDKNKQTARGSGLGLHIAKKIVEGHGGRIWAESVVGSGSTFRFTLPLAP